MAKKVTVKWLSRPEDHDYPAALSYLSLLYNPKTAAGLVNRLKKAVMAEFKAKDIFRASALPLLEWAIFMSKETSRKSCPGAGCRRCCWSGIRPMAG